MIGTPRPGIAVGTLKGTRGLAIEYTHQSLNSAIKRSD